MFFLDIFPEYSTCEGPVMYKEHFLRVHTFMVVDELSAHLRLRAMNPSRIEKLLTEQPDLVKHEVRDDSVILTAGTEELQRFIVAYASEIFAEDEEVLTMEKR
jgi:hypothetical protein